MLSIWETIKSIVKWLIVIAAIGYGTIWLFGKLAELGETEQPKPNQQDAKEILKPKNRPPNRW